MEHINSSLNEKNIKEVDGIIGSEILKEFNATIKYEVNLLILKF